VRFTVTNEDAEDPIRTQDTRDKQRQRIDSLQT